MSVTTNTLRISFSTSQEGDRFGLSLNYANPELKSSGGLATVQAAAAAIVAQQPFANVSLTGFVSADFVERTVTEIDI